jgi:hypothetical protein
LKGDEMISAAQTTEAAKAIRDSALTALRSDPRWKQVGPMQMRLLTARIGLLRIIYLTGVHKAELSIPYGLDIWAGPKVLSVRWSDDDRVFEVITFKAGIWVDQIPRHHDLPTMQDVPHLAP